MSDSTKQQSDTSSSSSAEQQQSSSSPLPQPQQESPISGEKSSPPVESSSSVQCSASSTSSSSSAAAADTCKASVVQSESSSVSCENVSHSVDQINSVKDETCSNSKCTGDGTSAEASSSSCVESKPVDAADESSSSSSGSTQAATAAADALDNEASSSSPCTGVKVNDVDSTDDPASVTAHHGAGDSTSSSTEQATQPATAATAAAASSVPIDDTCLHKLLEQGLESRLAHRLCQLFSSNKLTISDLDDRAIAALKDYGNVDRAICILDEFESSDLEHVANKSAFLCCLMKTHRQKEKQLVSQGMSNDSSSSREVTNGAHVSSATTAVNNSVVTTTTATTTGANSSLPGPDEGRLQGILDRTGYSLDVTSGQRKYGGPPPDWTDPPPGLGCEIFVGKIPKEMFEDELIPIFEQVGRIWDLRLMIDPMTGFSRGFAFITYCNKEDANAAQLKFDGYSIKEGKVLKVNVSVPNLRLFVGNIPKSKSKEEIFAEFSIHTAGLGEVIVYTCPDDRRKNRGFCFLEYDSHKSASQAKRKLTTLRSKVWQCDILVDWADPQEEPDQETMSKVKVLYVRNLVSEVTENELKQLFTKFGTVERVKKIKDYAFVHFQDRDHAVLAMEELNASELHGVKISVSLAKPPSDRKKKEEMLRNRERRVNLMLQQKAMVLGPAIPHGAPVLPPLPHPHLPPPPHHPSLHHPVASGPSRLGKQGRNVPPVQSVAGLPTQGPYGHRPYQLPAPNYYYPASFNYCLNGWSGFYDPRAPLGPSSGAYSTSNPGGTGRHSHHGNPGPSNGGNTNSSGLNNGRNNRSLWTSNGVPNGATHSVNGPSNGAADKGHKNWNRNRSKNAARTGAGDSAGNS